MGQITGANSGIVAHNMSPTVKGRGGFACVAGATIASLLLLQISSAAQDVTEPSLKAAYIYNFALFTEWPSGAVPPAGPVVLCVVGDAAVGDALVRTIKGRMLAGRALAVSLAAPAAPQRVCHVLYISGVPLGQATQMIAGLRDLPVLTISDIDGFAASGGIAEFFFEHGPLRFTVEIAAATRAHLQISSKLLRLAKPR